MGSLDPGREWSPRTAELAKNKHLRQQAKRAHKAYKLIHGTKDALSWPDFLQQVAQLVALCEVTGAKRTANVGGITVGRGPMEGYSIDLHAADVFAMHLGGPDLKGFERAMGFWNRPAPEEAP